MNKEKGEARMIIFKRSRKSACDSKKKAKLRYVIADNLLEVATINAWEYGNTGNMLFN